MRWATARMASNKCSPCGARGSACTITSEGTISPTRFSMASLSACTCSRLDGRAPDIGRKMQRVGLQRLAGEFSRHMQQRPGARQVNAESAEQDHDGGDARLDMHAAKEKAAKRFVNNVQRCEQKQPGLDERGKILEFSVAIGMLFVGGPIPHPHGEKRDKCRHPGPNRKQR